MDDATGQTMYEEIRVGVLAYMAYHEQNPEAAWAAYVGLGRSDPVLLGVEDDAKNRQMEHIMSRINRLLGEVERDQHATRRRAAPAGDLNGWLALTFEICRQRIIDPTTDAEKLADACAHALLDAIARVPEIPEELGEAMSTSRTVSGSGILSVAVGTMAR